MSPLKRGKVPLQRGGVYAFFAGVVADLSLAEAEDATDAAITAKLAKAVANSDIQL